MFKSVGSQFLARVLIKTGIFCWTPVKATYTRSVSGK